MNKHRIYWILTVSVFTAVLFPTLAQDGMFLDGVTYSAISRNLADGLGSFSHPHYTKTLYADFNEHPPLVFILQSFFFRLFGDAFYTERLFSLFMAILTAWGITMCWKTFADEKLRPCTWIPVLLWLLVPLVSWSYKNNMLENTMGMFSIFSVLFILKSLDEGKISYLLVGSILLVLACLSKGLTGLFPMAVPILYILIYKENSSIKWYSLYLVLFTLSILYLLYLLFPDLRDNVTSYLKQQLIPALNNEREITVTNRFRILFNLLLDLSLPIIILIFVGAKQWVKNRDYSFWKDRRALLFLLIAFAASIPLIITLKQRKYYLVPSIPFYALSISYFIAPYLQAWIELPSKSTLRWIRRGSLLILIVLIALSVSKYGSFSRDKDMLKDVYAISHAIPKGTIIGTSKDLAKDWALIAYMSRIGYLSLDADDEHNFYMAPKSKPMNSAIYDKYLILDLDLKKYVILKKKPPTI
ncbi:MAG: glycosyltransferase family 39 protein [Saprospiraceae bacterium]|nr:glycosyltransferase family 39 protein [Saprospiraceae bacterium]